MYCTKCGAQLRDDDRFCSQCGHGTAVSTPTEPPRALMLDKCRKKIAGVCAGFARYLDVDVTLMRVLWLAIAICTGGVGLLVYLAAWIVIPSDGGIGPREAAVVRTAQTS
ncbi:MAG: PspC domain-containing protein [Bryobacteraceae bacterium]|jgi:phage shock protein C